MEGIQQRVEMIIERVINQIFTSNTYLLHQDGRLDYWLVDIGDIEPIMAHLPADTKVKGVFLTHTHFDHLYGINALVDHFPDCVVYTSEHGKEGLYSDKLNYSRYHGTPLVFQSDNVRIVKEGERIELSPDCIVQVCETPGHDWSCLTYIIDDAVFSGDSYLPGVKVFTKLFRGDKEQAKESEKRIIEMSHGKTIYPGHGESVKM